jgi:hypothetical protein
MGGIFLTDRASVRATGRFGRDERFRFIGFSATRAVRIGAASGAAAPRPGRAMDPIPPSRRRESPRPAARPRPTAVQAQVTVGWLPWPTVRRAELSYRLTTQTGAVLGGGA